MHKKEVQKELLEELIEVNDLPPKSKILQKQLDKMWKKKTELQRASQEIMSLGYEPTIKEKKNVKRRNKKTTRGK